MEFTIVLVGGLVGGFLIPKRPKMIVGAILLAVLYVGVVVLYALANSYRIEDAFAFLTLMKSPDVTQPGLSALVVAGDIWVVSAIVAVARLLLPSRRSRAAP